MRLPRFTIGWLMFGVAMLCILFGLLQNATNGHSFTGKNTLSDMGLWPGLVAFGTASFAIVKRRGKGSPFLCGFAVLGWASVLAYLAFCFWLPRAVDIPIVYYLNRIDYWWIGWLIDSDSTPLYMLNLLVLGLYLATPQLMLATVGGLVMRWAGSSTRLRAFAMRSPRERIGNPDGKLG